MSICLSLLARGLGFSHFAFGTLHFLTQNGFASSVREKWNFSPSIGLICPPNMVGNSLMRSSDEMRCGCGDDVCSVVDAAAM